MLLYLNSFLNFLSLMISSFYTYSLLLLVCFLGIIFLPIFNMISTYSCILFTSLCVILNNKANCININTVDIKENELYSLGTVPLLISFL